VIKGHGKKAGFNLLRYSLHFVVAITSQMLCVYSVGCSVGGCVSEEKGMERYSFMTRVLRHPHQGRWHCTPAPLHVGPSNMEQCTSQYRFVLMRA